MILVTGLCLALWGLRQHDTRKINRFEDRLCDAFLVGRENQRLMLGVLSTSKVTDIDHTTKELLRRRQEQLGRQQICMR